MDKRWSAFPILVEPICCGRLCQKFRQPFQRLRIPKAAPLAALRKARNSFSVKADFWGVNCRAAARGVLFARKKASLAFLPDAACGGGLGCCWHRLLPRYAWRGLSRCGAIGDAVSLSCSCKKVTKEARQRGRRSHAAAPFGIPFWLLVQFVILLRRW